MDSLAAVEPLIGHKMHPVAQTLRRMELDNKPIELIHLEKKSDNPPFDIDYGVLSESGNPKYETVYQFKSVESISAASRALKFSRIRDQLANADASNKIFEIELRKGTIGEFESTEGVLEKINNAISQIPGLKIVITDINGQELKTYSG